MSRNTQAIILFLASQVSWAVCCMASAPAFVVTTYEDTFLQWAVMLNGLLITGSSSVLLVFALIVALRKRDELSPGRLDPMFKIGMGVTAFMLIVQVAFSAGHAAMQPDESEIVAPPVDQAQLFDFQATLDDGQFTDGVRGFVIEHPRGSRPVFVTTSQQFSTEYGLDRAMKVEEINRRVTRAAAIGSDGDVDFSLGEPIDFEPDALFATGYGSKDSQSDVLFFEAPGMEEHALPIKIFDGLEQAPNGQKLFALSTDGSRMVELEFSFDAEELWEADAPSGAYIAPGTPVFNWKHQVVGFVTLVTEDRTVEVFPMHLAYDYLGEFAR